MSNSQEVVTFGCRLNIYESEIIKKNLSLTGQQNIMVINTCVVTDEAEKQARQAIRKAKKNNPSLKVIVTGCAAQLKPESFAMMPEVDKVIGNQEKLIPTNYQIDDNGPKIIVGNILEAKEATPHLISGFETKTRAFIQVQNGCNHRCTFCNIPFARGNSRSTAIGAIVSQIQNLLNNGYNEIVFTGVDVTSYGADLPGKPTFAQMIKRTLALLPDLKRLRLSSIDVAEIDYELFELMANEDRLMPHFHLSLQSGDDMILKRMKRRHNRQQVIDFCHALRVRRPNVAFGCDIIAGFPTETEEMFANTLDLIAEADLQYLHVFPYSERQGTPAARMPQVEKSVRKARATLLRRAGQHQLNKFFLKNIHSKVQLLIEKNNNAHSENFIPAKITGNFAVGQLVAAELVAVDQAYMIARAVIE